MASDDDARSVVEAEPSGRLRKVVLRNIAWNSAGVCVDLFAGFLVAPFLVRRLGVTSYGLWIVLGSLSGYFGLLDFGLRGSLGRELAFQRANNAWEKINRTFNSALAIYSLIGAVALAVAVVVTIALPWLFDLPVELIGTARLAMLLVGINMALSFPGQVFDGSLWAAQRFDLLNRIDISASVIRVALTFLLIDGPQDLVTLAGITLATWGGAGGAKAVVTFRLDRFLETHWRHVEWGAIRDLFSYGWRQFVLTTARLTKTQLSPVLIASFLGVAMVTPLSIARRLQDYASKLLWTATGVLTPVATGFHAGGQERHQQYLFIEGGKYCAVISLFLAAYFIFLGRAIIGLWMGSEFAYASLFLVIIVLGELLPMTQSLTGSIILATARHGPLARLAVIESLISIVAIALVARPFGLVGVCIALAIPQAMFSGIATLYYGCKVADVSVTRYLADAMSPAIMAMSVPVALLWLVAVNRMPTRWSELIVVTIGYGIVFMASSWFVLKPVFAQRALLDLRAVLFRT
ncbi:MAG: oligosaccharide flippase family protein [Vicinamibacterales bacterium]